MKTKTIQEFLNREYNLNEYFDSNITTNPPDKATGCFVGKATTYPGGTTNLLYGSPTTSRKPIDAEKYPFTLRKATVNSWSRIWFLSDADAVAFDKQVYNTDYPLIHSRQVITVVRTDINGPVPCYANIEYIESVISFIEKNNKEYAEILKNRMNASAKNLWQPNDSLADIEDVKNKLDAICKEGSDLIADTLKIDPTKYGYAFSYKITKKGIKFIIPSRIVLSLSGYRTDRNIFSGAFGIQDKIKKFSFAYVTNENAAKFSPEAFLLTLGKELEEKTDNSLMISNTHSVFLQLAFKDIKIASFDIDAYLTNKPEIKSFENMPMYINLALSLEDKLPRKSNLQNVSFEKAEEVAEMILKIYKEYFSSNIVSKIEENLKKLSEALAQMLKESSDLENKLDKHTYVRLSLSDLKR